jgi:hypothetical protein
MNVIVTVSHGKESTYMKTFTIDTDNNITVHASRKAARERARVSLPLKNNSPT